MQQKKRQAMRREKNTNNIYRKTIKYEKGQKAEQNLASRKMWANSVKSSQEL